MISFHGNGKIEIVMFSRYYHFFFQLRSQIGIDIEIASRWLPSPLLLLSLPSKVWETHCFRSVSYYITPTVVGWCIAILRFFSLILHHPDGSRVMYCYSTFLFHYYYSFSSSYYYYYYYSTHFCLLVFSEMPWSNFM